LYAKIEEWRPGAVRINRPATGRTGAGLMARNEVIWLTNRGKRDRVRTHSLVDSAGGRATQFRYHVKGLGRDENRIDRRPFCICSMAAERSKPGSMDWDDLRFFLELIRHGSLSAAARKLRVTQSTVGRRLASLERHLRVRLMHRTGNGYVPTLAGEAIREHVERIEAETRAIERLVSGLDEKLEGVVRVSSPPLLASHLIAPCAAALHARHPDIELGILCHGSNPDVFGEGADLAVQLERFDGHTLVVRKVGTLAFGMYASLAYLSHHGEPDWGTRCAGHRLIAMAEDSKIADQAEWLSRHAGEARIVMRTDSRETQLWATLQGGGLALLPCFRADREHALQRLRLHSPAPEAEIWLAVHRDNRHVPRIRIVLDCIADAARRNADTLNPEQNGQIEAA
jgi:DNA-binding transcriptional LysR family regulator